jgi:16S rRNA (adenine1518-N6/adenine1519-N6)-dimethyltransferase
MTVVPKKSLGQHFLVDRNVLRVVDRLAELDASDVVLEIGPGLGILTRHLAERVAFVHAVEVDTSLEPQLGRELAGLENVELLFGDALALNLGALDPPPSKLVANLPYNIATPLVAESLTRLPSVERWTVMVQREVADRFFAPSGTKEYGAVSVLMQLTAERIGFHPVSRVVFRPVPNVDSALVAFRRTRSWGTELNPIKAVVQGAFAHRRKTAANSLELAGFDRDAVEAALAAAGLPAGVRAERIEPPQFERLAELLQ